MSEVGCMKSEKSLYYWKRLSDFRHLTSDFRSIKKPRVSTE